MAMIDKTKTVYGYTRNEYKLFKKYALRYLILFSLLYCCLYCTRNNLSAVSAVLISDLNWSKADLGIITGIYFWTYGFGQLINGRLSELAGPKRFLLVSSVASIVLNLLFAYQRNLFFMAIIWGINGYVQAMAWPAGMSMLSKWWPGNKRGFATGFALAMSGLGQVITTLSVVIGLSLLPQLQWRSAFIIPTAFPLVMCIIFMIFCKAYPSDIGLNDYIEENEKKARKEAEHKAILESKGTLYPYITMLKNKKFRIWIFVAFLQGLIRYGLVSWIPLYYVEKFGVDVTSGLLQSLALPMGMAIGTLVVPWLTDTFCPDNRIEAASISGIIATLSIGAFAFLNPTIIWQMIIIELLLFVAGFAIYAVTGCVWAFSTDIGGRMFSGTAAGILNFSQYMGAAIQAILYGFLLDTFGWNLIFVTVCLFNVIISVIGIMNKYKK